MERKDKILDLYFNKHLKQKDIASLLNVSKYIVSRTVTADSRYIEEKKHRHKLSKEKHSKSTVKYVMKNRNLNRITTEQIKQQHIQASLELSGGRRTINNIAFRKWNSSVYKYDYRTKTYILKKGIVTGFDVPKKIKM